MNRMDEKQARKRLRLIETEMRYLERMIGRQKKVLDSVYSRKYIAKGIAVAVLIGIGMVLILYSARGASGFALICGISIFILLMVFFIILIFVLRESTENRAWELRHGMECWLKHYEREKERILGEHPNLKYEEIRPYIIHYWELYTYYAIFSILIVFGAYIWFSRYSQPNPALLSFNLLVLLNLAGSYLYQRHYRYCPPKQ